MKVFPSNIYLVELLNNYRLSLDDLKENTFLSDSLISMKTDKLLIGKIEETKFKLISSEPGIGAVCIFLGEFKDNKGIIQVRLHKAFRIMFSILMMQPFIGLSISIFQFGLNKSFGILLLILIITPLIRFGLIEIVYRKASKNGLRKLKKTLKITKLTTIPLSSQHL